ncbi:hypothetical protein [Streptomyces sp. NBC_01190]|uniref:hypothetical protein n=1 Tax=Streptomyces sp. NBC_01190 TaxID=2903767 RepID=UPI003866658D|nr:hypothetical protein OG519_15350 [Streptomyces sp. NBC_01190]
MPARTRPVPPLLDASRARTTPSAGFSHCVQVAGWLCEFASAPEASGTIEVAATASARTHPTLQLAGSKPDDQGADGTSDISSAEQ